LNEGDGAVVDRSTERQRYVRSPQFLHRMGRNPTRYRGQSKGRRRERW